MFFGRRDATSKGSCPYGVKVTISLEVLLGAPKAVLFVMLLAVLLAMLMAKLFTLLIAESITVLLVVLVYMLLAVHLAVYFLCEVQCYL